MKTIKLIIKRGYKQYMNGCICMELFVYRSYIVRSLFAELYEAQTIREPTMNQRLY
jgi:hypothetical protein